MYRAARLFRCLYIDRTGFGRYNPPSSPAAALDEARNAFETQSVTKDGMYSH